MISRTIAATPAGLLPVRVRCGPAKGARWTFAPFSYNWRCGGEGDLEAGLSRLAKVSGAVCWDFGAHHGIHTVGMAMQVGPAGQVAAFEPDPVAFSRLERHVRINDLRNVRLFQAAVSNKADFAKLIVTNGLGSSFSHFRYEDEHVSDHTPFHQVKTIIPDELVSRGEVRLPDLIKIDVQGHGAKALEGSIKSIVANSPIIIFSSHSPWELAGTRALLETCYSACDLKGVAISWDALEREPGLLLPSNLKSCYCS